MDIEVLRPTEKGLVKISFNIKIEENKRSLAEYHLLALTEAELQMINEWK